MKPGTLYGIGLGPGDPELMTRKAHRLICEAEVIAYPRLDGMTSFARSIAADAIPKTAREIPMEIPMTVARAPAQRAYDKAARDLAVELSAGRDVMCLCEGDALFYGSFMYIFDRLAETFAVEVIPGVTSLSACCARSRLPLVARNEVLSILPGPLEEEKLASGIRDAQSVAIMKVGRHLPKIRAVIARLGLTENAVYVERATLASEVVTPLAEAPEVAPYFSMVLISGRTS